MLSQAQRTTILELNAQQVSKREIARVMGISRVAVRKVLRANSNAVPELHRVEKAEPHRQQILELFDRCKGNLVRVHEELLAGGAKLSYTALTAFCRRHGIGYAPPTPSGQFDFSPNRKHAVMRRKAAGSAYSAGDEQHELPIMGKRLSQRVDPCTSRKNAFRAVLLRRRHSKTLRGCRPCRLRQLRSSQRRKSSHSGAWAASTAIHFFPR